MTRTDIVDMRGWRELAEASADGSRARRSFLGRIVSSATAWIPGRYLATAIRCRRRPERKACGGAIELLRTDVPREIRWRCTECADRGVIHNWRNSEWDLERAMANSGHDPSEWVVATLERDEFELVAKVSVRSGLAAAAAARATKLASGRIQLYAVDEEFDALIDLVAAAAHREGATKLRQRLHTIYDKLITALLEY